MKTEKQVHSLLREMRDREAANASRRTLESLMTATVDSMMGILSIEEIMTKCFEPNGNPWDWGRNDLGEAELKMVREYLAYIYATERVPV